MLVMQLEWAYRTLLNVDCNIQGRLQRGNKIISNVTRNWCTCADEDIISGGLNDKVGVTISQMLWQRLREGKGGAQGMLQKILEDPLGLHRRQKESCALHGLWNTTSS